MLLNFRAVCLQVQERFMLSKKKQTPLSPIIGSNRQRVSCLLVRGVCVVCVCVCVCVCIFQRDSVAPGADIPRRNLNGSVEFSLLFSLLRTEKQKYRPLIVKLYNEKIADMRTSTVSSLILLFIQY